MKLKDIVNLNFGGKITQVIIKVIEYQDIEPWQFEEHFKNVEDLPKSNLIKTYKDSKIKSKEIINEELIIIAKAK